MADDEGVRVEKAFGALWAMSATMEEAPLELKFDCGGKALTFRRMDDGVLLNVDGAVIALTREIFSAVYLLMVLPRFGE